MGRGAAPPAVPTAFPPTGEEGGVEPHSPGRGGGGGTDSTGEWLKSESSDNNSDEAQKAETAVVHYSC